jgi:hypothetical protein
VERTKLAEDLEEIRTALREAQEIARRANQRVNYLAKMLDAVQGLMSLDPEVEVQQEVPAVPAIRDEIVIEPTLISPPVSGERNGTPYVKPREAILRFLDEQRRLWPLSEIVSEMERRDWIDPSLKRPVEAIRAAANRLVDVENLVERSGPSSYRLPQDAATAATPREELG